MATTACCLAARAAVDRPGPGHVYAPLLKRTEDGQGRGVGERVELHGDDPEDPHSPGAQHFAMDVDEVPVAGSRPDRLTEVRPQQRVLRRTVEQNVEPVSGVPVLGAPVPQMVDQTAEVVRFFVSLPVVAEQVIEVPTIIPEDPIPQRALLRAPQLAEQLVDVPTTPSYVLAVVAVQTLGWRDAQALFERFAASPGRDTNTGQG